MLKMNSGQLDKAAIQGWVANRFYYQVAIPVKDAAVMANCPHQDVRRKWVQSILDHDGRTGDEGGIEAWLDSAKPSDFHARSSGLINTCFRAFASRSRPILISPDA